MTSSLSEIKSRFAGVFDDVKKATKPFATSPVNEATVKGLKKGIAMYIDACNSVLKELENLQKMTGPDASQLKAENALLAGKVQSLAFAVQEAEANLARQKALSEEEVGSLKGLVSSFEVKVSSLQSENDKLKSIGDSLNLERKENKSLLVSMARLAEDYSGQRMEWQSRLAGALALQWEDRHLVQSQRSSEDSLRSHIEDLLAENASLRGKLSRSISVPMPPRCPSLFTKASDATVESLRESIQCLEQDFERVSNENRQLVKANEQLLSDRMAASRELASSHRGQVHIAPSAPRTQVKEIRHASVQTSGADSDELLLEIDSLRVQLASARQEGSFLADELTRFSVSVDVVAEEALRAEIVVLRNEVKKKSFRISRLLSENDRLKIQKSTGLDSAFAESQRSRAEAELEVLALRKQIAYLQSRRVDIQNAESLPRHFDGESYQDPLVNVHREAATLENFSAAQKTSDEEITKRLQSEVEYREASVVYWESQQDGEAAQRMLADASHRLLSSRDALRSHLTSAALSDNFLDFQRRSLVREERHYMGGAN